MNQCIECGRTTTNPKFCTKSCVAKTNNRTFPKREVEAQNKCLSCNRRCSRRKGSRKTQLCSNCFFKTETIQFGNKTKGDLVQESLSYASKHRYEKIRQHAKRLASTCGWCSKTCEKCGYDKHTELCHIKPISSFPSETLISDINSRHNICFLCPNCHWELDHQK